MAAVHAEPDTADTTFDPTADERTGHPLFPRSEHETGPDRRRIDLIQIERLREDGTWETCPKTFKASELRSWREIVEMFGGGSYRARAQCAKTYQWQGTSERKEFTGPSRPFVEERRAAPPAPAAPAPTAPTTPAHGPAANQNAQPIAPPGWPAPPPGYPAVPPGYPAPLPGWPPPGYHEPPPWAAQLMKALERVQAPPVEQSLMGLMFKAMTERDALFFKVIAERQAVQAPSPAANPLEVIRELKPLLDSNTAPGQFMQGIEIAKSLMQQAPTAAPPQEDFMTTFTGLMRQLAPGGGLPLPGMAPPPAPAAPAPPPPPPSPAAPPPGAPVMQMDDLMRMIVQQPHLMARFVQVYGQHAPAATPPAAPAVNGPPMPAAPPAWISSGAASVAPPPAPAGSPAAPPENGSHEGTTLATASPRRAAPPEAPSARAANGGPAVPPAVVAANTAPNPANDTVHRPVAPRANGSEEEPAELSALLDRVLAEMQQAQAGEAKNGERPSASLVPGCETKDGG
jgi:hypothetical protein